MTFVAVDDLIPALPFCRARLSARRPPNPAYPKVIEKLGYHIRKRRLDLGLLQREVGTQLGASVDAVRKWERGETEPNLRLRPATFRFLGYDPGPAARTVGQTLVRWRQGRGQSQEELAVRLQVDPGTLSRWERGRREPAGADLAPSPTPPQRESSPARRGVLAGARSSHRRLSLLTPAVQPRRLRMAPTAVGCKRRLAGFSGNPSCSSVS